MDMLLSWVGFSADLALLGPTLAEDKGLRTAVILSLFLDRRAAVDDVLPDGSGDVRGWWADAWPEVIGDHIGSRLWLLSREKQLQSVVLRAKEYAEEALEWLVTDGVARTVTVTAEIVGPGTLGLGIEIERPTGEAIKYSFNALWEAI